MVLCDCYTFARHIIGTLRWVPVSSWTPIWQDHITTQSCVAFPSNLHVNVLFVRALCSLSYLQTSVRIQNYAMRMILHQPPCTDSESLRHALGWSTLKRRRHNAMLYQVHRSIHNGAPSYLGSKFIKNSALGYTVTCGFDKLHLRRPCTNLYRNSFEFQGALHYNKLPCNH